MDLVGDISSILYDSDSKKKLDIEGEMEFVGYSKNELDLTRMIDVTENASADTGIDFGSITRVYCDPKKKKYIVKPILKNKGENLLGKLNHPNITKPGIKSMCGEYICFPWIAEAEDVFTWINRGGVPVRLFQELLSAMKYLYSMGIVDTDRKNENLLLIFENGKYKLILIDFGGARDYSSQSNPIDTIDEHTSITAGKNAPEFRVMMNQRKALGQEYDPYAAEMWTTGIKLLELIYGRPFVGQEISTFNYMDGCNDIKKLFELHNTEWYHGNLDANVLNSVRSLLEKMLVIDPKKRIKTADFLVEFSKVITELENSLGTDGFITYG